MFKKKPAIFPLPQFHALVCPYCDEYKMEVFYLAGIPGFKCLGPNCDKFITYSQAELYIPMEMVEE
jgi:hypothetical protein